NVTGLPCDTGISTRRLNQSPNTPETTPTLIAHQNIARTLRPRFSAVAAGTTTSALVSSAPTALRQRLTITARTRLNRSPHRRTGIPRDFARLGLKLAKTISL